MQEANLWRTLQHDLRTELDHIIGYCELMIEGATPRMPAMVLADLQRVRSAAYSILSCLEDIAGGWDDAVEAVDLSVRTALNTIVGLAEQLVEQSDTREMSDMPRLRAASGRLAALSQILFELLAADSPPSKPRRAQPIESNPNLADRFSGSPVRVLVIDDDEVSRDLLSTRLSRLGLSVALASRGAEGLTLLEANSADLMLLDIRMPEMDGFEVCRLVRENPATRDIPIIMMTGSNDPHKARALESGAQDLLLKPFDQAELAARVNSALRIRRQSDELRTQNAALIRQLEDQSSEVDHLRRIRRFLPPFLEELMANDVRPLSQPASWDVVLLVGRFDGLPALEKHVDPADVLEVLSDYYSIVIRSVSKQRGSLERFTGDDFRVFFNDSTQLRDRATRAVTTALEIRSAAAPLGRTWKQRGHDLCFQAGIAFGHATVGIVSTGEAAHHVAVGDVMRNAYRLSELARERQILVDQYVCSEVERIVEAQELADGERPDGWGDRRVFSISRFRTGQDALSGNAWMILTKRESEIAACIGQGLSNEQIASKLTITADTVAKHLEHIFRKLDLNNRSQLTAWVATLPPPPTDRPVRAQRYIR
jgi:DNA-binding NarL/FixJ family response regulator